MATDFQVPILQIFSSVYDAGQRVLALCLTGDTTLAQRSESFQWYFLIFKQRCKLQNFSLRQLYILWSGINHLLKPTLLPLP